MEFSHNETISIIAQENIARHRDAEHDYEMNLKAELEMMTLRQKIDELRETQRSGFIAIQNHQLRLPAQLADRLQNGR